MSDNQKKRTGAKAKPEQKADSEKCCGSVAPAGSCCKLQSLVSIDERGQMILPKEIRDKANIRAGDKLAITSLEKDGRICCILLTKADELAGGVRIMLGAVMKDLAQD
ncbi:MAG: AbrB/MazE/SpoVT family DNA-binding domain-containing protein [Dehalococcoidia bacterium]|nr:AbrB/MazE/SpoVT family DNA-binding domain-containing protein [Dehalococcoidia bacterium]